MPWDFVPYPYNKRFSRKKRLNEQPPHYIVTLQDCNLHLYRTLRYVQIVKELRMQKLRAYFGGMGSPFSDHLFDTLGPPPQARVKRIKKLPLFGHVGYGPHTLCLVR